MKKKEKIVKRQKVEIVVVKRYGDSRRISYSNKENKTIKVIQQMIWIQIKSITNIQF